MLDSRFIGAYDRLDLFECKLTNELGSGNQINGSSRYIAKYAQKLRQVHLFSKSVQIREDRNLKIQPRPRFSVSRYGWDHGRSPSPPHTFVIFGQTKLKVRQQLDQDGLCLEKAKPPPCKR